MNGLLFVGAIAAFLVAPNLAINCRKNRCTPKVQTMCKYPDPHPAAACGEVSFVGITKAQQTEIIDVHNEKRQQVAAGKERLGKPDSQPAASNMKTVSWDDELAQVAQRWANQCSPGHDECRDVDRFAVGQNTFSVLTREESSYSPVEVIQQWYDEVNTFNAKLVYNLTHLPFQTSYTQLVWANTEKVGCGKIVYKTDKKDFRSRYYMVCNYGPAGNRLGEPVYRVKK